MMQNAIDDDEYVAKLLKQDAKTTAKKYEMVGLDAFLPQRSVTPIALTYASLTI
jgi:hypothetical protein